MGKQLENMDARQRSAFRSLTFAATAGTLLFQLFCSNFLSLFVHNMGMTPFMIGILFLSIQVPTLLQLASARIVDRRGAKALLLICMFAGPILLFPLIVSPQLARWLGNGAAVAAIFAGAIGYTLASSLAGAPWMTILKHNLPHGQAAQLLGRMNRISLLIGLVVTGGFSFFLGEAPGSWRFQVIFVAGAILGISRVVWFRNVEDYRPEQDKIPSDLWADLGQAWRFVPYRRLLVFTAIIFFTGGMCTPFRPLFIKEMGFSERLAAMLTVPLTFGAYAVAAETWGRLADRYGSRPVFVLAGLGVACGQVVIALPSGNGINDAMLFGLGLFLVSSFWGGIDAANVRRLYSIIPERRQSLYLVLYGIAVTGSMAIGSFAGGSIMKALPERLADAHSVPWLAQALNYRALFLLASLIAIGGVLYSRRMAVLKEISAPRLLLIIRLRAQRALMGNLPAAFLRRFMD